VDDRVAGLIGHAIELVKFVFADGSGETIAHFHGYDAPAVLFVFFNSFAELVELSETELVIRNSLSLQSFVQQRPTLSSVQIIAVALSLVQYRTCSVPELRPGKKSAICFHVKFFVSFSSTSKASSPGKNLTFEPLGFAAGSGIPGCPTTDREPFSSSV
jgi:hypothetical protein